MFGCKTQSFIICSPEEGVPTATVDGLDEAESLLKTSGQDLCLLAAFGGSRSDLVGFLGSSGLVMAARVLPGGLVLIVCLGSMHSLSGMTLIYSWSGETQAVWSLGCQGGGREEGCRDLLWICWSLLFGGFCT